MRKAKGKSIGALIVDGLREFTEALESGADIKETFTCHRVECTPEPTAYHPDLIRKTRNLLHASQAVFAMFLGVSVKTVRSWEQGDNAPSDLAKRFMDEIRHDPDYWRSRFRQVIAFKQQPQA